MSLSLAERRSFYDEIGKLLAAGFPYAQTLETMLSARPGARTRRLLTRLRSLAAQGKNLTDSFSSGGLPFSAMEVSLISACEKSGQLQRGCEFLSRYYGRLDTVRRQVLRRATYPLFMLHFGIIMLAVPRFFQGNAPLLLARDIGFQLLAFYLIVATVYWLAEIVKTLAVHSCPLDRLLNMLPLLGGIRRSLALSRFCTTYQMQLDAGVNIMDSLSSAARASASANLRQAIRSILPEIRSGNPAAPALAATGVFPTDLMRGMVIGEKTGALDAELLRAAADYDEKALRGIETVGDWLPKVIYLVIALFLAWNIISVARSSTQQLNKLIEGTDN